MNGDGSAGPFRADDMFHNGTAPDWVNLDKVNLGPGSGIRAVKVEENYGIIGNIDNKLAPADDLSRRALDGLLIADMATAQEVLDRVGKLDRIDLILLVIDAPLNSVYLPAILR